ncbi:MAG: hypothetical protein RL745_763, partial [Actinomycetota bacterium]
LTAYLFSPEDAVFDTRGWQSAGLLTWSAHLAAVCALLYRSKQRTSPITTATALGAGLLFTGGIRALDFDLGFWSGVPTAIGALAITVGILYAIRSQADNQPEIRTLLAIFGAIGWLAFLVSTNTPAQVNLGAWVWSAHAGVLAWLLQRRQKIMASSIAAIIALSWLAASRIGDSWVMDLPRSIAFGFCLLPFAAGLVLIVRKGTWVAGGWPVPAIAALLFANISSNSERYFVGILPIPLIPEEADVASNTAAPAMLVASVAIAIFVNRSKHLAGAIAGGLLSGSGLHLLVRSADLDPLEKWTIPFGASALLFGFLAKRINPELNSAAWLSPAAFTLTLPSALISLNQPAGLRLYVVVAAVVACLALGLVTNYAGLLLPGSIGTVLVTLQPVVHQSGAAAPFISLLLGGGTLIALGWKFERLRNRDGFKSLR